MTPPNLSPARVKLTDEQWLKERGWFVASAFDLQHWDIVWYATGQAFPARLHGMQFRSRDEAAANARAILSQENPNAD